MPRTKTAPAGRRQPLCDLAGAFGDLIESKLKRTYGVMAEGTIMAGHGALLDRIHSNLHQSRTLATLRDTLLPKLLSGELNVTKQPN